jgi:hypothetical protein
VEIELGHGRVLPQGSGRGKIKAETGMTDAAKAYLKRHTERLIKDVGFAAACELTGRSKATLGRYFSEDDGHGDRFIPIDAVAALEAASSFPHVTVALAELNGGQVAYGPRRNAEREGGVNGEVIVLSQRFAILMAEYHRAIEDGVISVNEARRLLAEVLELQRVLMEMKLKLEAEGRS